MKIKCEFTFKQVIKFNACQDGINCLKRYLDKNNIKYNDNTKINVLTLLESNPISHVFWVFRCFSKTKLKVIVEVSKRAAARAAAYAAADPAARAAAYAAADPAAYAAYAAADAAAYAAYAAADADAAYAAYAADHAAYAAADAAAYAAYAAADATEREKQKKDFIELLKE